MGLKTKDANKPKIPSTYPKDHDLFSYYNEKFRWHKSKSNANGGAETKAQRIAFAKTEKELVDIVKQDGIKTDSDEISYLKKMDIFEITKNKPNYFLTLSMPDSFRWNLYNRNYQVSRLYKTAAVLIYKLMIQHDSRLKYEDFEKWPFFIGRMEHFDAEGEMVAPHLHLFFKSQISIAVLLADIRALWGSVVTESGSSGIDLQMIPEEQLEIKANYILKSAHQDNLPILKNGVDPYEIARYAIWDQESIATDRWLLNRTTLRKALSKKLPVIARNSPLAGLHKTKKQDIRKLLLEISNLSARNKICPD